MLLGGYKMRWEGKQTLRDRKQAVPDRSLSSNKNESAKCITYTAAGPLHKKKLSVVLITVKLQ
jgi:hypothetical protein